MEIDELHEPCDYIRLEEIVSNISVKEILLIIKKLPNSYKLVFNLYVIDGYKHEEIAKYLNISVGTSKSNLHKARLGIQKMLAAQQQFSYESRAII